MGHGRGKTDEPMNTFKDYTYTCDSERCYHVEVFTSHTSRKDT